MSRILLIGCGFLGKTAADFLLATGWEVSAVVHSEESARELEAVWIDQARAQVLRADVGEASSLQAVLADGDFAAWVHCASSGGGGAAAYEQIYLRGVRNLRRLLPEVFGVFVSSTSVYGQTDGSEVAETSPAQPSRETGRLLLAAEEVTRSGGGAVLRLAGLYGPGRSVLLRKFLRGEARLEAGGHRWINQIHREDAAQAVCFLLEGDRNAMAGEVFNGADDTPQQQRSIFAGMAERLRLPLPPEGEPDYARKRGWTNKRVLNAKLRGVGWEPKFPDYFSDWARLVEAESASRTSIYSDQNGFIDLGPFHGYSR